MLNEIKNSQGERLDFTIHHGGAHAEKVVLIGHGVTGNKDRPFVAALAEAVAKAGFTALRFSFSGNGLSGGRFEDSTISKEVGDLGAVIDALEGRAVAYVGHSMGGAVGVLRAAADPRVRALVSLAGMVHTAAFAEREFGMVKPGEGCMWDEPGCPLSKAYMEDMAAIGSVVEKGASIQVPWLLVHGTEDDVVPPQDSRDIQAKAPAGTELAMIPGANHVFSGSEAAGAMSAKVSAWLLARFA